MNTPQNYLSISIKPTEKTNALVKQFGSKNKADSLAAGEAIASVLATPVLLNILQAPVISNFFRFGPAITEQDIPAIPLSDFFDVRQRNFLNVWSAVQSGGLASNKVGAASDLYVDLLDLYSAMHFEKKWARSGRTASVANSLTRLAQEVLIKRNNNAAYVTLGSLAGSRIDGNVNNTATGNLQVVRTNAAGVFGMDDLNTLMIKYHDVAASWVGGTPVGIRASLTDLVGSPAFLGQIRAMSYNPQNVTVPTAGAGTATYLAAAAIAAPDAVRAAAWSAGGESNFLGINFHEYNEFGKTVAGTFKGIYNQIFADASNAASLQYLGYAAGSAATFAPTTEQLVLGLNTSMNDLLGLRRSDNPSEWSLSADDQWSQRDDKAGFYGSLTEGFVSIDNRAKIGICF